MRRKKKKRIFPLICMLFICVLLCAAGAVTAAGLYLQKVQKQPLAAKAVGEVTDQPLEDTVPFTEITIDEAEVAGGYYYQLLSDGQQLVYKEILQGIREQAESIYIHCATANEFGMIYEYLLYDRPEVFWCTGMTQITSYSDYSEVRPGYICQGEELAGRSAQIEAAANACLAGIAIDAPDYEKVKYVFEYLVNTVDYNMDAPDNQNIYSALVNRASVCAGYSRAAQYLLQRLGLECIYVVGTIPEQGPHAWNIVKCNGQYYQMDVTFGDPVFFQGESGSNIPLDSINYGYLCCTDADMYRSHTPEPEVYYPECVSMDLNYYVLNGMYYDVYDRDLILQNMNQSVFDMQKAFTCKFPDEGLYQQAHDDVINNLIPQAAQNLAVYYGLETVWYTYVEDPKMAAITVYWGYQ